MVREVIAERVRSLPCPLTAPSAQTEGLGSSASYQADGTPLPVDQSWQRKGCLKSPWPATPSGAPAVVFLATRTGSSAL